MRQRIAVEAARIMADQDGYDFSKARSKAAQRLGCRDKRLLPSQPEIEQALIEYRRLFQGSHQPEGLHPLRLLAADAMKAMAPFKPRLVGPVLSGAATTGGKIELHLFADTPEEIALHLMELQIPWRDGEKRIRYRNGERETVPIFRFHAGETEVELVLFPPEGLHHPPLEPMGDQPQARASLAQLEALIAEEG